MIRSCCRKNTRLRDNHCRQDTHQLDTHPERDTHIRGKLDSHRLDTQLRLDTHVRSRQLDTHPELDTHVRDTHCGFPSNRGFVLIATLWTLAAMAVLAAHIDGVASADIERAVASKAALERELAQRSTEATLAYLLSTNRMNHRGLMLEPEQSFSDVLGNRGPDRSVGAVALTGETYAGPGGALFSIQDENGLVPVNAPRSHHFAAALSYVGVAPADIARIVPRVEDYVDMDNDLSLGGAERFDYRRPAAPPGGRDPTSAQRRPPPLSFPNPANWTMHTPMELRRVIAVNDIITPDQWRRLLPMLTVRQTAGYNFNTMRPDVLKAVLKLDQGAVDNIVAERLQRSVASLNRVFMLTGTHVDIDPMGVQGMPSRFLKVSIWHNADGLRSVAGMVLTPYGDTPWRIDYRYKDPMASAGPPAPGGAESAGAHRDLTEPAIDNESSDAGVLQAATPLFQ